MIAQSPFVDIDPKNIDTTVLQKQLKAEQKQLDNQQTLQKQLDKLRKEKEKLSTQKEKLKEAFAKIENDINLKKQSIKHNEFNIKELEIKEFENTDEKNIQQKIKEFNKDKEIFTKADKELKTFIEKIKNLSIRIEEKEKILAANKLSLEKRTKLLNDKIQKSSFENSEKIIATLALNIDIESSRKKLDHFFEQYNIVKTQKSQLEKNISNIKYDEKEHLALKEKVANHKTNLESLNEKIGKLKQEIEGLQTKIKSKQKIEKELAALRVREENIKILKRLFTGKGFVNYVASLKLKNLCIAANKRFEKLTHRHLSLELSPANEIIVRDRMNENKTRSIRTLSGGQTFQASLCMAIALSDIVNQHNGEKADFFFLDEGFGSLDKNALRIVFETLQSLRKENKIVGVISHVDELQEEIQTHLTIHNGEEGSKIHKSWA